MKAWTCWPPWFWHPDDQFYKKTKAQETFCTQSSDRRNVQPDERLLVWLNVSQEHRRLPLGCRHADLCPQHGDSHEEGQGGRGGWGQKQVGEEEGNSHVTGPSCSVDGERKNTQSSKRRRLRDAWRLSALPAGGRSLTIITAEENNINDVSE